MDKFQLTSNMCIILDPTALTLTQVYKQVEQNKKFLTESEYKKYLEFYTKQKTK